MRAYTPARKCTCPVFLFKAEKQTAIQGYPEGVEASFNWQPYVQDSVRTEIISDVNHYSIIDSQELAAKLRHLIEKEHRVLATS